MARGVITIDGNTAHVILGALQVCVGEGISGINDHGPMKGPDDMLAALAERRLVHEIAAAFPEIAAIYSEPQHIDSVVDRMLGPQTR